MHKLECLHRCLAIKVDDLKEKDAGLKEEIAAVAASCPVDDAEHISEPVAKCEFLAAQVASQTLAIAELNDLIETKNVTIADLTKQIKEPMTPPW